MAVEDRELVSHCLDGQPSALRAFVETFQSGVFGLCFRMLGNREDAEDVSQEVFLRALRHLRTWDGTRPLKPWILTIAANRCRTHLGSRARHPASAIPVEDVAEPGSGAVPLDLADELQLALEQLREEYRLCFVLRYVNELSLAEIGTILDCPEGTIKTWLFRVRRELAEHLTRRGFSPCHHELHRI